MSSLPSMLTALLDLIPSLMLLNSISDVISILLKEESHRLSHWKSPWVLSSFRILMDGLKMICFSSMFTRSTRCDRMAKRRFTDKQRAAYWKRKYHALRKQIESFGQRGERWP